MAAIDPASLANLRLRIKFDDLGQANDSDITSITNTGSIGGVFVADGVAPVYKTLVSPTGKAAAYFNSASAQLRHLGSRGLYNFLHTDAGYTLFVVFMLDGIPAVDQIFIDNTNYTDTNRGHTWAITSGGKIKSFMTKGVAGQPLLNYESDESHIGSNVQYFVDRYEHLLAGDDSLIRANGIEDGGGDTANEPHSSDDASRDLTIGHRGSAVNDTNSFVGHYLFEIFAYEGRKLLADIEGLEQYIVEEYIEVTVAKNAKETIFALVNASSWGTAVAVGANAGMIPKTFPELALQGEVVPDSGLGNFQEIGDLYLTRHRVQLSVPFLLRRTGMMWKHLFHLFGTESRSGTAPNITHQAEWQSSSDKIATMAAEIGNADIVEYPGIYTRGATIAPSGDGLVDVTIDLLGDTINYADDDSLTNKAASFDAVTYITKGLAVLSEDVRIRINAQAGDALDNDDSVCAINWQLTFNRDVAEDFVTQCANSGSAQTIALPTVIGFSDIMLKFQLTEYDDIDVFNEFKNESEFKADVAWTATIGTTNYVIRFEFPRLKSEPYEAPVDAGARIPVTRRFRAVKASANPTGMATSALCRLTVVDAYDADYV